MKKMKLVLVGNGMAGVRTIEELLKLAPDLYDITVFGAEPHGNYNRILLSPVLAGEQTVEQIMLNDLEWYAERGITLHAGKTDLTFGDTKEGTMALRLAETMRLKPNKENAGKPGGHIVNSEGVRDDATWGKRAAWCDYYGPVEGKTLGAAIFDHPTNPRFPTWWHVRDYGLFAANPFGRHDFESLPDKAAGNLVVPAGQSVTFRYRFYLHEGDEKQGKVAERYAEFSKTK